MKLCCRRCGSSPPKDHLLIAGIGIGEPKPVASTFGLTDEKGESLGDVARIDTMVTVVDAHSLLADLTNIDLLEQRGQTASEGDQRTLAAKTPLTPSGVFDCLQVRATQQFHQFCFCPFFLLTAYCRS